MKNNKEVTPSFKQDADIKFALEKLHLVGNYYRNIVTNICQRNKENHKEFSQA